MTERFIMLFEGDRLEDMGALKQLANERDIRIAELRMLKDGQHYSLHVSEEDVTHTKTKQTSDHHRSSPKRSKDGQRHVDIAFKCLKSDNDGDVTRDGMKKAFERAGLSDVNWAGRTLDLVKTGYATVTSQGWRLTKLGRDTDRLPKPLRK